MAKARPNKTDDKSAEKPAEKADEAKKPGRTGVALNTYIDEELREQVDAFMADHNAKNEHHATVRSTVEAALKHYLKAKGFWPPKHDSDA